MYVAASIALVSSCSLPFFCGRSAIRTPLPSSSRGFFPSAALPALLFAGPALRRRCLCAGPCPACTASRKVFHQLCRPLQRLQRRYRRRRRQLGGSLRRRKGPAISRRFCSAAKYVLFSVLVMQTRELAGRGEGGENRRCFESCRSPASPRPAPRAARRHLDLDAGLPALHGSAPKTRGSAIQAPDPPGTACPRSTAVRKALRQRNHRGKGRR